MENRYCVIMCGGIGSRFWPFSKVARPKQFLDFFGTGRSLLQMTFDRVSNILPVRNILAMTNEQYAPLVKEQLPELSDDQILLEPDRRNTAPCIAWAAYHIRAINPNAVMLVSPSDHLILREDVFKDCVIRGFDFVAKYPYLLTMGIQPNRPETGYGYIQMGKEEIDGFSRVKTFTEKPDIELARVFIESGEFAWNSGIFMWGVNTIIDSIHMEKEKNVFVQRADFGWSDVGSWGAFYEKSPKTETGNVIRNCKTVLSGCENNIFASKKEKLVVASGLKEYIVVDDDDILLICPLSEEQKIKQYVNEVKANFGNEYL